MAVLAVLAVDGPPAARQAQAAVGSRPLYWGAYVGGAQYGRDDAPWDMSSVDVLASHTGKQPSLLEWGLAWYDTNSGQPGLQPFPATLMDAARRRGYIPVLSWGSYAARGPTEQPDFSLRAIIDGTYDGFIRQWATDAAAWGHPFILRFDWEMNTNGAPYSETANGNRPGEFATMWQHVHDIFTQVGATNASWFWSPNVDYQGSIPVQGLYPGPSYVDWVGLDGYNWGTNPNRPGSHWQSVDDVFRSSYLQLGALAPGKPVMIGETASTEYGGSKAAWIQDLLMRMASDDYASVGGVVWFNKNADGMDWIVESSAGAQAVTRGMLSLPFYLSNQFASLDSSPVPPPR